MCELPKCHSIKTPTARKEHRCCECGGIIRKGEKYEKYSGIWDEPQSYKTCSDCTAERDRVIKDQDPYDDALVFGSLYEDLSDWEWVDFKRVVAIFEKRTKTLWPWMQERLDKGS